MGDMSPDGRRRTWPRKARTQARSRLDLAGQVRSDVSYLALNQPGGGSRRRDRGPLAWPAVGRRRDPGQPAAAHAPSRTPTRGEVAYAVPFRSTINVWLRPGQHGLRPADGAGSRRARWTGSAGLSGLRRALGRLLGAPPSGTAVCLDAYARGLRPGQRPRVDGLRRRTAPTASSGTGRPRPDVSYLKFRLVGRQRAASCAGCRWRATGTSRSPDRRAPATRRAGPPTGHRARCSASGSVWPNC